MGCSFRGFTPAAKDPCRARVPRQHLQPIPAGRALIRDLRPTIPRIRRQSRTLSRQLVDALSSVAQNLAEGSNRIGLDRQHFFRISLTSLREVGACLDIAVAHGWLDEAPNFAERDRLCGMLFSLQR